MAGLYVIVARVKIGDMTKQRFRFGLWKVLIVAIVGFGMVCYDLFSSLSEGYPIREYWPFLLCALIALALIIGLVFWVRRVTRQIRASSQAQALTETALTQSISWAESPYHERGKSEEAEPPKLDYMTPPIVVVKKSVARSTIHLVRFLLVGVGAL